MHVAHLSLHDFRSYTEVDLALEAGVTAFVGANGQGKTNLVEAVDYVATHASHRVASDTPLVRAGAQRAVIRVDAVRDDRHALLEIEIHPGRANRARLNRSPLPRTRDALGILRTVLFAPDDLTLVKGDPGDRRTYLDTLLVSRTPRLAGARSDYDRVLRQRNSLLKTAGPARRGSGGAGDSGGALATLDVWDSHLARTGAELTAARLDLVRALRPHLAAAYARVAEQADPGRVHVSAEYKPSWELPAEGRTREDLEPALLAELGRRRDEELVRGVSLVGPHRDDVTLGIGELPAKGYASHGESWSLALALRLAAFELLRSEGDDDPVLILDDVFAELDGNRRERLAEIAVQAEQVLVTAAVPEDLPKALSDQQFEVRDGGVSRVG